MIHCSKCGWQPVPEKDLPVELPDLENWKPLGTGVSPLAQARDWVKVKCPRCQGPAERETDVSDTFLDSAWYFFRYTSTDKKGVAFDQTRVKKWLPVEMYIGGQEHAVLHLMYTRFLTMVLHDLGLIDFEEPFKRFYAHGLLIKDGAKMSKSKGNVVIPDDYIQKFGADSLRCYLMFLGPFGQGGDFRDRGIAGMYRFLGRAWRISQKFGRKGSFEEKRVIHRTIKKVTQDIENLRYNTALAALMEYVNFLYQEEKVSREAIETLVLLFAPFAPHLSEEIWVEVLKNQFSVHQQPWLQYDEKLLKEETVMVIIQVNGKLRGQVEVKSEEGEKQSVVESLAKEEANVAKYLEKKKIKKVVFVPGKLINFVIEG
jgi:leucyl-tRNA synthetase